MSGSNVKGRRHGETLMSEVTRLVAEQNQGATATGYPDSEKQPEKDPVEKLEVGTGRVKTATGSKSKSF